MRLYAWVNNYLSSIQKGIQTAHLVHSLFTKYTHPEASRYNIRPNLIPRAAEYLNDWALNHRTIIILNGGNCAGLRTVCDVLNTENNSFPWTSFHEDEQSLNKAHTVTGIVLPSSVYDRPQRANYHSVLSYERDLETWIDRYDLNKFELEVIKLLDNSQLAI
jgi:hypothetical protein